MPEPIDDTPKIIEVKDYQSIFRANKISKEFNQNFIIKTSGDEYQRIEDLKKTLDKKQVG